MRHTDLYKQYQALQTIEREELKKAVLAHGGEFCFKSKEGEDIDGVYPPVVMAGDRHWDSNCDCVITRVVMNDGFLEIYGYDEQCSIYDEILLSDFEYGHLGYIIDAIPETDEIEDVSTVSPVDEVAVVSLCRADIEDAGYDPDITDSELQQVASRIGKYLEWQEFFPQFLENVREACDRLNMKTLDKSESEKDNT